MRSNIPKGSIFGFSFSCEIPSDEKIEEAGLGVPVVEAARVVEAAIEVEAASEVEAVSVPSRIEAIPCVVKQDSGYRLVKRCRKRILVADDMKSVIVTMKAIFVNDFQLDSNVVTYVKDGWEAVREFERNLKDAGKRDYRPYSLVILDYNMPKMDGL